MWTDDGYVGHSSTVIRDQIKVDDNDDYDDYDDDEVGNCLGTH